MDKKKSFIAVVVAVTIYFVWCGFVVGAALNSIRLGRKAQKAAGTSC